MPVSLNSITQSGIQGVRQGLSDLNAADLDIAQAIRSDSLEQGNTQANAQTGVDITQNEGSQGSVVPVQDLSRTDRPETRLQKAFVDQKQALIQIQASAATVKVGNDIISQVLSSI